MLQANRRVSRGTTSGARLTRSSDRWRAVHYVTRGELAFLFFTAVSVALHPGFVLKRNEGGMSNYGLHIKTAVPYTLALLLLALYSRRAALLYADGDKRSRRLRVILLTYCGVLLSVLVSTYFYTFNSVLKDLHFTFGTALIVLVGVASLWMYQQWPPSIGVTTLLLIQLCGDALALGTVIGVLHVLFASEIVANIGFASLLIRSCRRLATEEPRPPSLNGVTT
jgi:hypothetical protein